MKRYMISLTLMMVLVLMGSAFAAQTNQLPLAGTAIPQFVQPLPLLTVMPEADCLLGTALGTPNACTMVTRVGNGPLNVRMCEFDANILPLGAITPGVQTSTRVFGYIEGAPCPTTPQDTYIGPVVVSARNGGSTDMTFTNNLGTGASTGVLAWKYSFDVTLHWGDPLNGELNSCAMAAAAGQIAAFGSTCAANYDGAIPAVPHIHGGEVPPELDGGPDAWVTSDGLQKGHGYYSFAGAPANGMIYKYPNTQQAAPVWFHDHLLGGTRLNVYAGIAGAYYILDPAIVPNTDPLASTLPLGNGTCPPASGNCLPQGLQPLNEVIPVVIQDRTFDTNGQLFFHADSAANILWTPNPEHPYWVPEFLGDVIVVNGKAWPYLNLEPKRYRFLFLNGSNARTYELWVQNDVTGAMGPNMYVIGTDNGYLDTPAMIDAALGQKLVIMPGERYEVIMDFAGAPNAVLTMRNSGRAPYPKGGPVSGQTTGRIMQFRVQAGPVTDTSWNPAGGGAIRSGTNLIVRLPAAPANGGVIRQLTLNEVMGMPITTTDPVTGQLAAYPGGPLEVLVNNTKWDGDPVDVGYVGHRADFTAITLASQSGGAPNTTYYSELPQEGTTEIWEIVNITADAHPIHLHAVSFQILNRQNFRLNKYLKAYDAAFQYAPTGGLIPAGCMAGLACGGYGPPLNYTTGNPRALGGNPDVTPFLQGPAVPPAASENGWKDTVVTYPGQVTRISVRWAPNELPLTTAAAGLAFPFDPYGNVGTGAHGYVWHCHIIDHEDNEMMRPDLITLNPAAPAPAARAIKMGIDY